MRQHTRGGENYMRKNKAGIFLCVIAVVAMLGITGMKTYAAETPDMEKKGSVHLTMQLDGEAVPGGTLTLYRAGMIEEDDGNYSFVPEEAFRDWGDSFWEGNSSGEGDSFGKGDFFGKEDYVRLAESLAEYVREQGLAGITNEIGQDGIVSFTVLEPGLYLLVQDVAAEGYNKAAPFLVSVPMTENGSYIYDVDASPKVELTKAPAEPEQPETPTGPKLPQTGQLNWPIPLLVVAGLCLLSVGWLLRFGKQEHDGRKMRLGKKESGRRKADLEK